VLATKKEKERTAIERIRRIGQPKKKKSSKLSTLKGDDALYYESCSMNTDFVKTEIVSSKQSAGQSSSDFELAQVEAADPNNWEITSVNRQRAMYGHLYDEYDKSGQSGYDIMAVLDAKANACSPSGDFHQYYKAIVEDNRRLRNEKREKQRLLEESKALGVSDTEEKDADENNIVGELEISSSPSPVQASNIFSPLSRSLPLSLPWELTLRQNIVPSSAVSAPQKQNSVSLPISTRPLSPKRNLAHSFFFSSFF